MLDSHTSVYDDQSIGPPYLAHTVSKELSSKGWVRRNLFGFGVWARVPFVHSSLLGVAALITAEESEIEDEGAPVPSPNVD